MNRERRSYFSLDVLFERNVMSPPLPSEYGDLFFIGFVCGENILLCRGRCLNARVSVEADSCSSICVAIHLSEF